MIYNWNVISFFKKSQHFVNDRGRLFFSRKRAHLFRKWVVEKRGQRVVGRKQVRFLKSYAHDTFGNSSFWPWLALYYEIAGLFIEGWLPDDFYSVHLLDEYNPSSIRVSEYKTFDWNIFPDFAVQPVIRKIGSNFFDHEQNQISFDEARDIISKKNAELVFKEDLGLGGSSVKFIPSDKVDLNNFAHIKSYVIQPVVKQHHSLNELNSRAVSTVRVFTFLNDKGQVEVKFSVLRFGVGDSRVDNTASGGGFCFVNSTGEVDEVAYDHLCQNIGYHHPDSGLAFKDITIVNYDRIIEKCRQSHEKFPYARFVGWDVAIDWQGHPVLLEWNTDPGFWKAEALIGPLFKKEFIDNNPQRFTGWNHQVCR